MGIFLNYFSSNIFVRLFDLIYMIMITFVLLKFVLLFSTCSFYELGGVNSEA